MRTRITTDAIYQVTNVKWNWDQEPTGEAEEDFICDGQII